MSETLTKVLIIAALLTIVVVLFRGLFFVIKDDSKKRNTLRMLTWRIVLSLSLIGFILLSAKMGWIKPHGGPAEGTTREIRQTEP